ncbi:MAG: hypothetical protein QNJ72_04950 [Pleurocapsa sp. MO_226.B13]|nr:hypothetical protein [Pleurocapsa sp. MO_226.B13]
MKSTKSWQKPTQEQINKAIASLPHPQQRSYFFNHLENPNWIAPLKKRGFFQSPPDVINIPEDGAIRFPSWSESSYLARMAKYEPKAVLDIILKIETNNPRVHEDFVDAALQMPIEIAIQLAPKVKTWIQSPYSLFSLSEKIGDFTVYLAKNGQAKKSLDLCRSLLAIRSDSESNVSEASNYQANKFSLDSQVHMDYWYYQQILKKHVPELVRFVGKNALTMIAYLLFDAIKLSQNSHSRKEQDDNLLIWEDDSRYWRPVIEENSRNFNPYDFQEFLTVAVRDAAEQIVEENTAEIRKIIQILEKRKWRVFHRIALYLIRKFPDADPELLAEELAASKYFDDSDYQDYEYAFLLKEHFANLSTESQQKILNFIENPNFDWYWIENEEDKLKYFRYWQLRRLTPLKNSLPGNWQQKYELLIDEFGAVEDSELVSEGVGEIKMGPVSPVTSSELASMEDEELISFLKDWQPASRNHFEPCFAGLGLELSTVSKQEPQRLAMIADKFQELHPIYACNLLSGLQNALTNQNWQKQESTEFPWEAIFQLCLWIVEKSQQIENDAAIDQIIANEWREANQSVASFLGVALTLRDTKRIPLKFRAQLWKILKPLTNHPEPTAEYEIAHHRNLIDDPNTQSLNTVRGQAMHTLIRYALWIRGYYEQSADGEDLIKQGFARMREVTEVLDIHLDPSQESSIVIRSVYGRWFPWLTLLDRNWASQNVSNIFPQDETLNHLYSAAWKSYITYCSLYNNVFDILRAEYERAVEQINKVAIDRANLTTVELHLTQHLMNLYWQGQLSLDSPEGMLVKFYEQAPDVLRGYALEFIGKSLERTKEKIPPEILDTLMSLWENRFYWASNSKHTNLYQNELAAFGFWFISEKFDNDWSMEQLKKVLGLINKIQPDFFVIKRLTVLSPLKPESVFDCFKLMIEQDISGMNIYGWSSEGKVILDNAIQKGNNATKALAIRLIHDLGRRGHWNFRDLLPKNLEEG